MTKDNSEERETICLVSIPFASGERRCDHHRLGPARRLVDGRWHRLGRFGLRPVCFGLYESAGG